ncbi:MAG: N-acyl-D-amino-acid deacylase family protein [Steroidobacteraceae bacterium]
MKKIACLLLLVPALAAAAEETLLADEHKSQLIVNASLIDGTGTPARIASVRIEGERIAEVGELSPRPGEEVVDARRLVLAPGFIDTHSHHDDGIFEMPDALSVVSQGVTTIVVGLDGGSELPLTEFFAKLQQSPVAVNVASYSGHNTLRSNAMGEDYKRHATAAEVAKMEAALREDMEAGALGLSTGLEYDPGLYSSTEEVVALARVAAGYGGRYASHIRSEDIHHESAMDEFLEIAREARVPSQVSHIKLARRSLWGKAPDLLARLDQARSQGLDITADIYPYTFYESTMRILFAKRDFDNRESAEYALRELVRPEGLTLSHYEPDPSLVGKNIAEIAAMQGREPAVVLMDLIKRDIEHEKTLPAGRESRESAIGVAMSQADVDTLMGWQHANICSDGDLKDGHPRGRGAFPRVFAQYVRERHVLALAQAVRKMTSLSAAHVGIRDRGVVRPGAYADLVLFDPILVKDQATMSDINRISTGIAKTWVNGRLVFTDGKATGARPGQVVPRPVR